MTKVFKIWYCSDNNFYYISYNGKEIASISDVSKLLVNHINRDMGQIFVNENNHVIISITEDKKISIAQGDGINPDNIILMIGNDIYHLQVTGNCPRIEYTGQKKTRLFAHKIWFEF